MWRFLRIRKDRVLFLSAIALTVCAGLAGLSYWYFALPTRFTVAVAPRGGPEEQVLRAYAEALAENKRDIRLTVVAYDDVKASAEALQQRMADLAVVRPDVFLPKNGATVAILREETLILVAPAANKINDIEGLAKKRLGVVAQHPADMPVIKTVLEQYDLAAPALTLVPLGPDEIERAFAQKQIDALAFVAAPVTRESNEIIGKVLKGAGGKLSVLAVDEADALALKSPAFDTATIPVGSLAGRPKTPGEEVKTVTISYRLMARTDHGRVVVSKVVQHLFQMRSRIAQGAPAINLMKAPETETSTTATLPNHQGAIDYFNREQQTFMDRYGDLLWLTLFAGGGLSSALAWIRQLFVRKRRELVDQVLDRLLCILSEARAAKSTDALDDLATEVDGLVTHAVRHARRRTTNTKTMTALLMAMDSARAAIADRRRDLLADAGKTPRVAEAVPRSAAR
jgi:TRAP-type uncharacterized transport system substrate-binding protein